MKKFRLSIVLLVLVALVLALVPAAFAQDDTLGASPADYTLWTTANASFASVKTATYDFTTTLNVSGMTDATQNVSASLKGSGVLDTDQTNPSFQLDVTGSVTQSTGDTPVNLGVRIAGGNIYFNDGSGWKGSKLSDAASEFSQGFAQGSGMDLSGLASGDLSSLGDSSGMASAMTALESLKPSDFLALSRADENGQAHFSLKLDIAKLLAEPALATMIGAAMSSAGGAAADPSATPAVSADQMAQMLPMMASMFGTSKVTFDEYVDPSSSMVSRAVLDVNIPLDMVSPGAAVAINFDINLSKYGEPVSVEAPADAVMMDATTTPSS